MQHLVDCFFFSFSKTSRQKLFLCMAKKFRYFFWNCSKCVECVECIERVDLERKKFSRKPKKIIPVRKYRITKLEFCFYILVRICKKFFSGQHSGYRNTIGSTDFGNIKFFMYYFPTQYTIQGSTDFSGSQKKIFWTSYQVQEYHW